jgi:radical SAM protein with 4Fe4S-binding SPASM domain
VRDGGKMTIKSKIRIAANGAQALLKRKKVFSAPVHVQIEHTTFCNLRCPQCPREEYLTGPPKHMKYDDYKKIVTLLSPRAITLNGLGEGLCHPDVFSMIAYAKEGGISINTTTNATALPGDYLENIFSCGLDLLNISVDAATPDTYRTVRGCDAFSRVLGAVRAITSRKKELGASAPEIRLCFVIQSANVSEMPLFYDLARELGADSILYQVFSQFTKQSKGCIDDFNIIALEKNIIEVRKRERRFRIPATNLGNLERKLAAIKKHYLRQPVPALRKCIMPWISLYVSVEGDVRPCCSYSSMRYNMGNIFDARSVLEMYNSKKYQSFRKALQKDVAIHPICEQCLPESLWDIIGTKVL